MFKNNYKNRTLVSGILMLAMLFGIQSNLMAQGDTISIYQYRYVKPADVDEFIRRETTYWSKIAEKAMEKGNLTFWALFQKTGGFDMENSPNFLFINTYVNVDKINEVWESTYPEVFPDTKIEDMATWDISQTMHDVFVKAQNWEGVEGANPETDYNYIKMTYHSSSAPAQYVNLEKEHWAPFIKKTMDENKTKQKAWGNALILSPRGDNIKYNSISYDLYSSLNDALVGTMDSSVEVPSVLFEELAKITLDRRLEYVYKIVNVVSAPPSE